MPICDFNYLSCFCCSCVFVSHLISLFFSFFQCRWVQSIIELIPVFMSTKLILAWLTKRKVPQVVEIKDLKWVREGQVRRSVLLVFLPPSTNTIRGYRIYFHYRIFSYFSKLKTYGSFPFDFLTNITKEWKCAYSLLPIKEHNPKLELGRWESDVLVLKCGHFIHAECKVHFMESETWEFLWFLEKLFFLLPAIKWLGIANAVRLLRL